MSRPPRRARPGVSSQARPTPRRRYRAPSPWCSSAPRDWMRRRSGRRWHRARYQAASLGPRTWTSVPPSRGRRANACAAAWSRTTRIRCLRTEIRLRLLRALALGSILFAASAEAQFTANASVVSDYRFRGVSLSDQKPAVQASVNWDDADGWYAGAFASTVQL